MAKAPSYIGEQFGWGHRITLKETEQMYSARGETIQFPDTETTAFLFIPLDTTIIDLAVVGGWVGALPSRQLNIAF